MHYATKLPFSVRSCEVNWKKMFIWNSDSVSLILLNLQEKKVSLTKTNHYLLRCSLDRVGYLQINRAPHSQPRTKLAQRHCDSFTSRVAGHSCGISQCSAPLKELSSAINSTVCVCWKIAMLDIALLDVTSTSRLTQRERESDRHGAPSCVVWPVKMVWPVGEFCSTKFSQICVLPLWHVVTPIVMALRSLIKTESRTAKLQQVSRFTFPRLNWQMNQRMNEHQSLLSCSLPTCPFLILSFQVVCFWEKILQHDFACCLSVPC